MRKRNECEIISFLHCKKCMEEYMNNEKLNSKMSPKDYSDTQTGFTKHGIQIWCNRHDCEVAHFKSNEEISFDCECGMCGGYNDDI
jgi:hypothetical protein